MTALMTRLVMPLTVLNLLGGLVSAAWLVYLGDWKSVGLGLLIIVVGSVILSLVLVPGLFLAVPGTAMLNGGHAWTGSILVFLSTLYTMAIVIAWNVGILHFFLARATSETLIPLLIGSYGAATAVWNYMAISDRRASSAVSAFFAQVGYAVMVAMILFDRPSSWELTVASACVMVIPLLINIALTLEVVREQRLASERRC